MRPCTLLTTTDARILLSKRRRHDSSTRSLSTRRSFTICDMHATTICATLLLALTTPLVLGGAQAASSEPFVAHRMIQRRRTGHDVNVVQRAAMPSPPASRIGAVALEPRGEGGQHPKALFIKCNGSDKYELCDTQYCIDMGTTPAETKCYEGQIIWADGETGTGNDADDEDCEEEEEQDWSDDEECDEDGEETKTTTTTANFVKEEDTSAENQGGNGQTGIDFEGGQATWFWQSKPIPSLLAQTLRSTDKASCRGQCWRVRRRERRLQQGGRARHEALWPDVEVARLRSHSQDYQHGQRQDGPGESGGRVPDVQELQLAGPVCGRV